MAFGRDVLHLRRGHHEILFQMLQHVTQAVREGGYSLSDCGLQAMTFSVHAQNAEAIDIGCTAPGSARSLRAGRELELLGLSPVRSL